MEDGGVDEATPESVRQGNEASLPPEAPRRIRALDQDVVNKIAAGEIIVAPVHALKELTENAVDAGATAVEILVKDGGLKLLQITDNGHGINREDLTILCERFTTSKLKAFEDLTAIGTYGFRGEALASISHIAHLRVTTRTKESSCAWQAYYSSGKLTPAKPGQSPEPKATAGRQGTQITVEDLFYNIPTRRRAFRSASEEYAKILDLLGRYAVHCTGVAFSCKKHGDSSMGISVQASATTVDRIRAIHSNAVANELISFETKSERWGFEANGYISNANYHVKKLMLLLFINHRAVESSAIKKAIEQTYATFLPKGGHPFVYLSLDIDPQRVDVNVHPTKREVNFLNEDEIVETICDEIRARLGRVDTSRTFMTQSLLPGFKIPTISTETTNSSGRVTASQQDHEKDTTASTIPRTPAPRTHENNLVRTDSKVRKITSMLGPTQQLSDTSTLQTPDKDGDTGATKPGQDNVSRTSDPMSYTYVDREPTVCRLTTIKNLRANVRDAVHNGLTDIISSHTFVGIVDERRRITAIQSGVKLFLVDYGMLCNEYFYQVGLTDFGNFGSIRLDPALSLKELLRIAAARERNLAAASDSPEDDINWDEVVEAVETQLVSRRDMLLEYFSLEISSDGLLTSLPLLIRGYMPSMTKLPRFLLRLGPHVDWTEEEACFRSFLRELACWYVPESLPPPPSSPSLNAEDSVARDVDGDDDALMDDANDEGTESGPRTREPLEDAEIAKRRAEVCRAVEDVLFPAFKSRLVATKGMLKGVVEIANLKGLYRVFERC